MAVTEHTPEPITNHKYGELPDTAEVSVEDERFIVTCDFCDSTTGDRELTVSLARAQARRRHGYKTAHRATGAEDWCGQCEDGRVVFVVLEADGISISG